MQDKESNNEIIFSENLETNFIENNDKLEVNFLRPTSFDDYVGQNNIIESLEKVSYTSSG